MVCLTLILFSAQWVETTQEDFADGWYEVNLYSSHRDGGAVEFVSRWDANNDGIIDLASTVIRSGPVIVWGSNNSEHPGSEHTIYEQSDESVIKPRQSAVAFADLDCDAYTELIYSFHLDIYPGTPQGPDTNRSVDFRLGSSSVFTADFNKDGYLDIAIDYAGREQAGIFWGSSQGFSEDNISRIPSGNACHNVEAADLNKDGWLDLLMVNSDSNTNYIYWGSSSGYTTLDRTIIPIPDSTPVGISIADLDSDGWLDLVYTGWRNIQHAWVHWGSEQGFTETTVLAPWQSLGGSTIADMDNDGFLDIVFFRGIPCGLLEFGHGLIQWGDGLRFNQSSTTVFGTKTSLAGGFIADVDADGYQDVLTYAIDGTTTPFYYGPDLYTLNDTVHHDIYVPGGGHGMARELGNVYSREYNEEYISSVFDAGENTYWQQITWLDSCPGNSSLRMEVRAGTDADTSTWGEWIDASSGDISGLPFSRYIQYRTIMGYPNPAYLPVLWEVNVTYGTQAGIVVAPDQAESISPGDSIDYPLVVRNLGDADDVIDLHIKGPSQTGWSAELLDDAGNPLTDPDADGKFEVGPLAADGGEVDIILRVTASADALGGYVDTTRVIGESNEEPGLTDVATLITTVQTIPQVMIEPDSANSTYPGVPIRYQAQVTNLGNIDEVIGLETHPGHPWSRTLYDSTGTTPITDAGQLDALGGSTRVWLEITPPDTVSDGTVDTTYLAAFSSYEEAVRDSIRLITTVFNTAEGGVIIEPDTAGTIEAGQTITYSLRVINTGGEIDEYALWTTSDQSWPVEMQTTIDQLAPAETLWIDLSITPPAELASIVGDPIFTNTENRLVWAQSVNDENVLDSASVLTLAVSPLDIHNYPNPFSGSTTFIYSIPVDGSATLAVYNRAGEHIITLFADEEHGSGIYTCPWNGSNSIGEVVAPGVYLYILFFTDGEGATRSILKTALMQP